MKAASQVKQALGLGRNWKLKHVANDGIGIEYHFESSINTNTTSEQLSLAAYTSENWLREVHVYRSGGLFSVTASVIATKSEREKYNLTDEI